MKSLKNIFAFIWLAALWAWQNVKDEKKMSALTEYFKKSTNEIWILPKVRKKEPFDSSGPPTENVVEAADVMGKVFGQ